MKKKSLIIVLSAVTVISAGVAITIKSNNLLTFANTDNNFYYHYARVEPTSTSHGSKEFWANCSTLTYTLSKPSSSYVIKEGVDFSTTTYFDELESTDPRYIEPLAWEDDKVYLSDCGYYNMGIPLNKNNPVELKTTLSADASSWFNTEFDGDVANGYRYIYRNACSDMVSPHYASVRTYANGALKISDVGLGFGSPMFTHTGAKLEFRIGINGVYNASDKPDKGKDTFHVYMFDKSNNLLGTHAIKEGSIDTKTPELKFYYTESNCSQVAFFEVRCLAKPYKSSQCYNVGISYCNIKSWEKA